MDLLRFLSDMLDEKPSPAVKCAQDLFTRVPATVMAIYGLQDEETDAVRKMDRQTLSTLLRKQIEDPDKPDGPPTNW